MSSQQPISNTFPTADDLKDIQGDLILGLPKRFEDFVFFTINNAAAFKKALKTLLPAITTTAQVQALRQQIAQFKESNPLPGSLLKASGINIAFTSAGLQKLGVTDDLGDADFDEGQLAHAQQLGDAGTTDANGNFTPKNWLPAFKGAIDGVFFVAGDSPASVLEGVTKVTLILGTTIKQVLKVEGNVRPGSEKGHEHFGFLDNISLPAIEALTGSLPGQRVVDPGVLIVGQTGDPNLSNRPGWAKNGSFLAYRHLAQLVPEFNKFLADNPINVPGLPRDKGSELLGARLVGRWKSGAPIDVTPLADDPELANDPQRNNLFDFSHPEDPSKTDQSRCPFAAHIRKTNPRSDLPIAADQQHAIMRAGIPFGPEVTPLEAATGTTATLPVPGGDAPRGLAFACYQSSLADGFEFLQEAWANNPTFPPKTINNQQFRSGFDPIIGQNGNDARDVAGTDPNAQANELTLPAEFVVSHGGAYFFVPSLSALSNKIAA